MKELADVLAAEGQSKAERIAALKAFLKKRSEILEGHPGGQLSRKVCLEQQKDVCRSTPQDGNPMRAKWKAEIETGQRGAR